MNATKEKLGRTIRITVKLRPDEYHQFFCHVRRIGFSLSAFFRESAAKAMRSDRSCDALFDQHETGPMSIAVAASNVSETSLGIRHKHNSYWGAIADFWPSG